MRAKIQLLLVLIMSCCSVWAQEGKPWKEILDNADVAAIGQSNPNRWGSSNHPFEISDESDLRKIAQIVNARAPFTRTIHSPLVGVHFILTNDIALEGETNPWESIGGYRTGAVGSHLDNHSFNGTFDGAGYLISNLYINNFVTGGDTSYRFAALFGVVRRGGAIMNLGVQGKIKITTASGGMRIGLLVGCNEGATIENCYAIGEVSYITNLSSGSIGNRQNTGLLVGYNSDFSNSAAIIRNCYAIGTVKTEYNNTSITPGLNGIHTGGLVGENRSSRIENSYAAVEVIADKGHIGTLVGHNFRNGSLLTTINDCYSKNGVAGGCGRNQHLDTINIYDLSDIDNDLDNLSASTWKIPGIPDHYPYLAGAFENSGNLVEVELNFNGGHLTANTSIGGTVSVKTNKGNAITLPVVAGITAPTGGYTGQG